MSQASSALRALFALVLLTAPSLAAPSPTRSPTGPATAAPSTAAQLVVTLQVESGAELRHYVVLLTEHACGSVEAVTAKKAFDQVKVCGDADGTNVRFHLEWQFRDGESARDIRTTSELVMAHGASQTIDGGSAKLRVTLT